MRTALLLLSLCWAVAVPAGAQQTGQPASQKEQAELAQPPGPRAQAQSTSAKDGELHYGPTLYDRAPQQTQRDAAKADETDKAPRTDEVENKPGAAKVSAPPDQNKAGTQEPAKQKKPVARRHPTTQDIATVPPPPPMRPVLPPAPLTPSAAASTAGAMPVQCDAAGCLTPSGQRLNKGIGNALIAPNGHPCVRTGVTVTCN